jgi:hypothetical protein
MYRFKIGLKNGKVIFREADRVTADSELFGEVQVFTDGEPELCVDNTIYYENVWVIASGEWLTVERVGEGEEEAEQ